jgi:hypothetical protein
MKGDPGWVPPLFDDYGRLLDPKKSPFMHGGAQCFLVTENGAPVGRICAQLDFDFDKQWFAEKGVAFFGFLDRKDDFGSGEGWTSARSALPNAGGVALYRGGRARAIGGEPGWTVETT